jgi:5'-phosphate synthase pdxT subunit
MKIGVLAIQGDFAAHSKVLASLGVQPVEVRYASQLSEIDGLIIPGGESTTMLKLLGEERLFEPLVQFANAKPVMGTCAGAIQLASEVASPAQRSLGILDIAVERNAYGRQLDSSIRRITPSPAFAQRVGDGELEAVFIRAPIIRRIGRNVEALLSDGGDPVLIEQGPHLAVTFHPELSTDRRVHQLFLAKVGGRVKVGA